MLWIRYRGMVVTRPAMAVVDTTIYSKVADTYHILDESHTHQEWEEIMSRAGWELGAGYMYRWHHAPGRSHDHLWGLEHYDFGDGDISATGDTAPELADLARQYGVWQWEINCSWGGMPQEQLTRWRAEDPTRGEDGTRSTPFPGWSATHPWLRAVQPGTGYESHYYYVMPERPDRETDALVKGVSWPREMTADQAAAYAREVGERVSARAVRHAADAGHISGARKLGRDWIIPHDGLIHYLNHRPKPGRK